MKRSGVPPKLQHKQTKFTLSYFRTPIRMPTMDYIISLIDDIISEPGHPNNIKLAKQLRAAAIDIDQDCK